MFLKADRLNAESLRLTKIVLGVALVTLMLYAASSNTVALCEDGYPPCPTISISCPTDQVTAGAPATVSVKLSGGDRNKPVMYNWTVSAGTITSGQGTPTITIDTTGLNDVVTATVEIIGLPSECDRTKSCSFSVSHPVIDIPCSKFDEFNGLKFNEEKARLDNLAIQLQHSPITQGIYIIFGSYDGEADQRSQRAVDYLVNTRGIDRGRITVVNGGCREQPTVELWVCVKDTPTPIPSNMATVNPCPKYKAKPEVRRVARRRGRRHGEE